MFAALRPAFRALFLSAAVALLAVGCAESEEEPEVVTGEEAAEMEEGPDFSEEVRTEFEAGAGATGEVSGRLRLLVPIQGVDAPMKLAVHVEGLTPGPHAWHIHEAPCGEEGPVTIPFTPTAEMEGIAGPLVADSSGLAADTVDVPPLSRVWVRAGEMSVHVHAEPGVEHGPTVACAIL